tara:strand:+ start:20772 stop:20975 length:204 start_codon:yes stop_codon:yes gene_type:complete
MNPWLAAAGAESDICQEVMFARFAAMSEARGMAIMPSAAIKQCNSGTRTKNSYYDSSKKVLGIDCMK